MSKKMALLGIIIGCMVTFSADKMSKDETSGEVLVGAKVTITHIPGATVTDASGAFTVKGMFSGRVVDTIKGSKKGIRDVVVTIPYGQELIATTDSAGYFSTPEASFSGVVVNSESQPVAGAWVSLQYRKKITAITDADGALPNGSSFVVGIRTPFMQRQVKMASAFLRGNRLMVTSSDAQAIAVSLFTIKGQEVFSGSITDLSRQTRSIRLPEMSTGFYLLKVTIGDYTAAFKKVFFSNRELFVQRRSMPANQPAALAKAGSDNASVDTLVGVADGYLATVLQIPTTQSTGTTITLTASKQWKPDGAAALEHQGTMVKIMAKDHNFTMGQSRMMTEDIDDVAWEYEWPPHTVSFSYDYWMDTTEVTQKQYADVMAAAYPDYTTPGWNASYGIGDNLAAYHCSKADAMLYCNARSKAEGLDTVYKYTGISGKPGGLCEMTPPGSFSYDLSKNGYRLPTEAEWEYACRGGTVTDFYWGKNYEPYPATADDTAEISEHALWRVNANTTKDAPDFGVKSGVASKKSNNYGLYDMAGSCNEYIHYVSLYYPIDAQADPKPTDNTSDTLTDLRGGNYGNPAAYIRSACRLWALSDYPYWVMGFRTVKEVR